MIKSHQTQKMTNKINVRFVSHPVYKTLLNYFLFRIGPSFVADQNATIIEPISTINGA